MAGRDELTTRIVAERNRQFNLPSIEHDVRNTPNDWLTIASHYLFEEVRRGFERPERAVFEDGLVKAAAVLLAALEHCELMQQSGHLT